MKSWIQGTIGAAVLIGCLTLSGCAGDAPGSANVSPDESMQHIPGKTSQAPRINSGPTGGSSEPVTPGGPRMPPRMGGGPGAPAGNGP